MTETLRLLLACLAGVAIGVLFFGGLWWTLRRAIWSKVPALWFLGSLLVRMTMATTGFYFVSNRHWERLLACLLGFLLARLMVTRFTRAGSKTSYLGQTWWPGFAWTPRGVHEGDAEGAQRPGGPTRLSQESSHAPYTR